MSNDLNVQATLNYIDKVHAARNDTARSLNRVVLVTLTVSLLLVLAAVGLVSPQGKISVSVLGANLKVSFVVLLASGMVLIACLTVYIRALILRMWALYEELPRLYMAIGFEREMVAMQDALTSPFLSLSHGRILLASPSSQQYKAQGTVERKYERFTFYAVTAAIAVSPTLAEIFAAVKVIDLVRWQLYPIGWQLLLGLLLIPIAVTITTAWSSKDPSRRFANQESGEHKS